jgi:predicted esterase
LRRGDYVEFFVAPPGNGGRRYATTIEADSEVITVSTAEADGDVVGASDVSSVDLNAGGNPRMRYFLIGAQEVAKPPAEGRGLLIVLPGGAADLHPFVRGMYKHVLGPDWLLAQLVAPVWGDKQKKEVVWPNEFVPWKTAEFTTEEFIDAVIAEVRKTSDVNPKRVFLLGWSSGGPPCYATALRTETPVTGALIAMSIFDDTFPIENARGRSFYLLQSPDDEVTPMWAARWANKSLREAGANVRLEEYPGGHGWMGSLDETWERIGNGIHWLDQEPDVGPSETKINANTAPSITPFSAAE